MVGLLQGPATPSSTSVKTLLDCTYVQVYIEYQLRHQALYSTVVTVLTRTYFTIIVFTVTSPNIYWLYCQRPCMDLWTFLSSN